LGFSIAKNHALSLISKNFATQPFKAFHSARATIEGIETAHMIRKKQLSENNVPAYKQFMALAG
jgi:transposase-like protein